MRESAVTSSTIPPANAALSVHARSVLRDYVSTLQRRGIYRIVKERMAEVNNTLGRRFIHHVAALGINDMLFALARAFDHHADAASVTRGATAFRNGIRNGSLVVLDEYALTELLGRRGLVLTELPGLLDAEHKRITQLRERLRQDRGSFLAHTEVAAVLAGEKPGRYSTEEIDQLLAVMALFLDLVAPFCPQASAFEKGEFTLMDWDRILESLESLLDSAARPWQLALPDGYALVNFADCCWKLEKTDGSRGPGYADNDPASVVLAAWLDSAGRKDLYWWNEDNPTEMGFSRRHRRPRG